MKDDRKTFPVKFLQGDLFTLTEGESFPHKYLDVSAITSLVPLKGLLSVIHLGSVFCDLEEKLQKEAAKRCVQLLSSRKDSIVFGEEPWSNNSIGSSRRWGYLRSIESFENMWKEMFGHRTIDFRAKFVKKSIESGMEGEMKQCLMDQHILITI